MDCWQKFKSFLRGILFPPGVNPVSPMLLLTFFLSSFANSMVLTMPFSFLPRMMKDFGVTENNVGYWVGITASSLYIGRTFASYFWGWLCDRIGSRKSLFITTGLIIITTLAFGVSKSVAWAITTRLMQGFVGGLIISLKAAVYCICDKTNSSLGFSFVLGAYSCGMIAGPALGGFIVYPVEKFPGVFSKGSLFEKYPVLLPYLVVVSMMVISYILVYFYIPETLIKRKSFNEKSNLLDSTKSNGHIIDQDGDTKHRGTRFIVSPTTSLMDSESFLLVSMKRSSQTGYDWYLDNNTENADKETISYFQLPDKTNKKLNCFSSCFAKFKESNFSILIRRRSVLLSLSLYGLVSFTNIGFDELFPIFADSSLKFGGLNFTTDQIGTAILIASFPIAILTFLMAQVERRLGAKRLTLIVSNFVVFVLPLFSYVGALDPSQFWYALLPLLILMRMAIAFSFFTVNFFLNNSVEPKYVGTVNGLGMTVSCFFRMVSPIILGALYSWSLKNEGEMGYPFNHFLPFVLCAVVSLIILFLTSLLPKDDIKLSDLEETENSSDSDSKGSPEHPDQEKA